jgi:hypothetical protein
MSGSSWCPWLILSLCLLSSGPTEQAEEQQAGSQDAYRLSQERNEHRAALKTLFEELDARNTGAICGDALQSLFRDMGIEGKKQFIVATMCDL